MDHAQPKRCASGFTLMETLVGVAVLIVLMALAFPAIAGMQKNLKMLELDSAARHIFIAAQNQLVSLRAAGDTGGFSAHPLGGEPADYTGSDSSSLTYLSQADATISKLLPTGSIESKLAGGYFVVEFDVSTGSIYGVFYSEESFTYDAAGLPRDRDSRKAYTPMLGYYGGAVLEGGGSTTLPEPQITITNDETLSVSMVTTNPFVGTVTNGDFFSDLTYLVTVRSIENPAQAHTFSTDNLPSPFTQSLYTYTLRLDSLTSGGHFHDICPEITPGDNVTVTVTVSYTGPGGSPLPSSASKTTNSLFASRSDNEVNIAYARHLQNLEPTVSTVSTVTEAVQSKLIDWSYYSVPFVPISNSDLITYTGNGLTISNLTAGVNVSESGLFGVFEGDTLSGIRLENAIVSGGTNSGALAGQCTGTVKVNGCGVYVTDTAHVSSYRVSGTEYVGGLIGRADTLSISNSFAAPDRVYGGSASVYMGGLVGYCGADSTVSGCYADTDVHGDASPNLGGLIGYCGSGSTVTDCYALGNLSSIGSVYFGGLTGGSLTTKYTNCYAAPTFDTTGGASTPYGFAGSMSNTYVNCDCLQSSGFADSDPTAAFSPIAYTEMQGWSGGAAWTIASVANSHPYDPVLGGSAYPFKRLTALEHYNDWPDKPTLPSVTSFAYYENYSDGTTGYYATDPTGRVAVNSLSEAKGPAIFDGYCLLSIGDLADRHFVFETASGDVEDWLADKGNVTITMDGDSMTYHVYEIPRYTLLNSNYDISNFYIYVKNMGNTYWYNPHFAKAAVNGATTRPTFGGIAIVRTARQLAAIGSNIYTAYLGSIYTFQQELDIDFAVYDGTDAYDVVSIGTSSQYFAGVYDGHGFNIALNRDSSHDTTGLFAYTTGIIQNVNLNLSATDPYTVGNDSYPSGVLCGTNMGTVENCTITFGTSYTIHGTPYGTVAGNNTGTITDCLVTGSGAISLNNGYGNIAGFVGYNSGAITDCYVRPGVSSYAGFTVTGKVASGFAYSNSGMIEHCSVTGVVTGEDNSGAAGVGFVYDNTGSVRQCYANCLITGYDAAGFAFTSNASGAIIQNCYAMLKVNSNGTYGTRAAAGFVYHGSSGVSNCYTAMEVTGYATYTFTTDTCGTDCYYMSWTGCGYNFTGIGMSITDLATAFTGDSVNWGGAATHVYLDQYPGLTPPCPYPLITGLDHYGDWLEESYYVPPLPVFAYYEKYGDSTYGYYALDSDGSTVKYNTLSDVKGAVVEDGYMILTPVQFTSSSQRNFILQTAGSDYTAYSTDLGSTTLDISGSPETYYRYSIPSWAYSNCNYSSAAFYQYIIIDGTTYWYNPHFAKAAVNGASGIPAFSGTAYVRATRQLANLGNSSLTAYWGSGFTYQQQLNLDFATYSFSMSSVIGTSSGTPFAGTYDGGGHTIILTSTAKSYKNALFGYNTGTLRNIQISNSGNFTMGSSGAVSGILAVENAGTIQDCGITFTSGFSMTGAPFGTIVGRNSGTVTGCLVTGSSAVTLSGSWNTGASFAGINNGTITHSYVRPGTATYAGFKLTGDMQLGGFVFNNSGTVTDCSVTGTVDAGSQSGHYAAGFAYTNTGSISRCYANCQVTGRIAAGFVFDNSTSAAVVQNCYAMIAVAGHTGNGGEAAGFVYTGSSGISNCYVAAQVTGKSTYTFRAGGSLGSNCYYYNWSGDGATSTGIAANLATLQSVFSSSPWGAAGTHVYQDRYSGLPATCPFPLLSGLDHYGDWIP